MYTKTTEEIISDLFSDNKIDNKSIISQEEMLTEIFSENDHAEDFEGKPVLIILSGSIGCGKSTLCRKLVNIYNATVINKDSLLMSISGDIYGKFDSNKIDFYNKAEEAIVRLAFQMNQVVIIDRLNYNKEERKRFIDIAKEFSIPVYCYDFGSGSEETLKRRLNNPRGVPEKTWVKLYDLVKENYETPSIEEGIVKVLNPPSGKDFRFIAFDLDNTIFESNDYPNIGELKPDTIELIKRLYKNLKNIIIIWTCRTGDALNEATTLMRNKNIPFDLVNENYLCGFETSNKIFYNILIDDRVVNVNDVKALYEKIFNNKE